MRIFIPHATMLRRAVSTAWRRSTPGEHRLRPGMDSPPPARPRVSTLLTGFEGTQALTAPRVGGPGIYEDLNLPPPGTGLCEAE